MTCTKIHSGTICEQPTFKLGDPEPEGYLAWHEWAEVQHKSGLRQKECGRCSRWKYPFELSDQVDEFNAKDQRGRVVSVRSLICKRCAEIHEATSLPTPDSEKP